MEIKVLGTGCSSCKALYETTKQAISELGCDATGKSTQSSPLNSEQFDPC